ncbi:MAG TPA: hypothetical protein VMI54_03970 [Polyangiaceae bacterium]|nr:hypothetical protein [Polyangiaceae bacterium]
MSNPLDTTIKPFLSRPEGKVGLVVTTAAVVATGYGLFLLLPVLITLATNLLTLATLCAAIAVLIYLVADGRVRAFAAYLYKSFFRALTGFFIQIDPIGILRAHIDELREKLAAMRRQLGNLNGQILRVERSIDDNQKLREQALALASAGKRDPAHLDASRLQARHAVKLEDSNTRLAAMRAQMQTLFRMLKKLGDTSELVLQDMQNTVDIKTRERTSIKAAYSAYRGALAILQGQSEGRELYDRTMEFLNDDYAKKLGEIELFMDFSDGVIKAADLENLAYDARATERLNEWERRLSESLLGDKLAAPVVRSNPPTAAAPRGESPDPLDRLLDAPSAQNPGVR